MSKIQFSAEEQAKIDSIQSTLMTGVQTAVAENKIDQEKANEAVAKQMALVENEIASLKAKAGVSIPGLEGKDAENFSFVRATNAIMNARNDFDKWARFGAGHEAEIFQNAQQTRGVDSEGGYLVPTEVSTSIIDILKPRSVLMSLGTTQMNLSGIGKFELPRVSSSTTAQWLGELATITESAMAFDNVSLDPRKVAALVRLSKEVVADANQSIEGHVRQNIASQLALSIDDKGINGTGASDTPTGILNTTGIQTFATGANGDLPTYANFQELINMLEDENAAFGKLAFLSNPRVLNALKAQTVEMFSGQGSASGMPVAMPLVSDSRLQEILGYGFAKTTQISKAGSKGATTTGLSKLIFGNFEDLIMASWGGLELDASEVAGDNFAKYSVQIRAVQRVDFAVTQPKSFAVATDIGSGNTLGV